MPVDAYDLSDPSVDITQICCGNTGRPDLARTAYLGAFERAIEYARYEKLPGDVYEFGTYAGFTARLLAQTMASFHLPSKLHLFDSFEGFPASESAIDQACPRYDVMKIWQKGGLALPEGVVAHLHERLSSLLPEGKLAIHPGFFDKTLPDVCKGQKVSILHLDCDLYESTLYVLSTLADMDCLQDGVVMLFDDFYCNRANPHFGEQAALRDFLARYPRYSAQPWFTYSWGAAAWFLNDGTNAPQSI